MNTLIRSRFGARVLSALSLATVGVGLACFSDHSDTTALTTATTCTAPTSTAGATIVFIRSFAFDPASIHVKSGGKVAWVNCEPTAIPHTATSDAGLWDSGLLQPNDAFVRTFATVGTFPYHCTVHPGMKATVIVD